MFGTAGFERPAGFLLLGPAAVCVASTEHSVPSIQPGRLTALMIQPGRLDSGARG